MMKRIISLILMLAMIASLSALAACGDNGSGKDGIDKNDKYLMLVNKKNAVGADFVPEDLVDIDAKYTTGGKSIQLEKTALEALIKMLDDMKVAGITNVTVTSAYRTYDYQKRLFNNYIAEEAKANPTWSEEKVKEQVLTYSAEPGTSEHQTGLCVDLFTNEMEGLYNYGSETEKNPWDKGFAETDAYEWLCENAHKYGFILRFPEDKTDVTGYSYESWHYRYVGVEHATKIHEKGITLEEYLD